MARVVAGLLAVAFIAAAGPLALAGGGAATNLSAAAECVGGPPRPAVHMRWTPSRAGRQRVQVTVFSDGFATGRVERSERLSRTRKKLTWRAAHGEAKHYWRVMTRINGRSVPSEVSTFMGPGCVGADPPHSRREP